MATQVWSEVFGLASPVDATAVDSRHESRWVREGRARRGPTPEIFFTRRLDNSRLLKAQCPVRRRQMRSFACAMSALFALMMFYGWQHYLSIQSGYHVESERQQVAQLQEQNRELRLNEAQLSDPARIDRLARQMGLEQPEPGQVVRPDASSDAMQDASPAMAEARPFTLGR